MFKLSIILIFFLMISSAYSSEELEKDIQRSIQQNQEQLENDHDPEQEQIIRQQQEILRALDDVDLFQSLEDARKELLKLEKQKPKYTK